MVWFQIKKTRLIHPTSMFFCGENLPNYEKGSLKKTLFFKNGFKKRNHHILTSTKHMMPLMQCMAWIHRCLHCKVHTHRHHISWNNDSLLHPAYLCWTSPTSWWCERCHHHHWTKRRRLVLPYTLSPQFVFATFYY